LETPSDVFSAFSAASVKYVFPGAPVQDEMNPQHTALFGRSHEPPSAVE
jgi:hypothetical protein